MEQRLDVERVKGDFRIDLIADFTERRFPSKAADPRRQGIGQIKIGWSGSSGTGEQGSYGLDTSSYDGLVSAFQQPFIQESRMNILKPKRNHFVSAFPKPMRGLDRREVK